MSWLCSATSMLLYYNLKAFLSSPGGLGDFKLGGTRGMDGVAWWVDRDVVDNTCHQKILCGSHGECQVAMVTAAFGRENGCCIVIELGAYNVDGLVGLVLSLAREMAVRLGTGNREVMLSNDGMIGAKMPQ